jgi:integrase
MLPDDNRITLGDYLKRWIISYAPSLSANAVRRYAGIINNHLIPGLGRVPLAKLRLLQIQHYYDEKVKTQSPNSVRYHHAVLHKALDTAITWQLLTRNPSHAAIIPPKEQTEFEIWNEEELSTFLNSIVNTPWYPLFQTALYTGLRRSELLAIRWRDLELVPGRINVSRSLHSNKDKGYFYKETKSKYGRRSVTLPSSTIAVLQKYKADTVSTLLLSGSTFSDSRLVFCREDGQPYSPNFITGRWNVLVKRSGLKKLRLHDARHTHASILLKAGVHLKIVQERLGHSSIQITADLYSHIMPGIQESAAEKFDQIIKGLR